MKKLTPIICRTLSVAFCLGAISLAQAGTEPKKTVVFFGDSLAAGLGVKPQEAFPSLIEAKIRERDLPYEVVNAGLSGDTTAGGLRRIGWVLQRKIDVLVLELGANDGLRGLPISNIKSNLQAMIDKAKANNPQVKIVIAGMQMPPNLGGEYAEKFRQVFHEVAKENDAAMIPFLLEGVGGSPELNQTDMIHPNPRGHQIIADEVWKTLEPVLREGGSA